MSRHRRGSAGYRGQGGMVTNGDLNIPVVLRKMNTIVAVNDSLSPAVPTDVSDAAKKYVATATDLTTAALAHAPVDQLVQLTKTGNSAVDACTIRVDCRTDGCACWL